MSSKGRVKNIKRNRLMKGYVGPNGYLTVILSKDGNIKNCYVHRLVAEAFIKNDVVNHKNFNKLDNRVENLEWCSQKYNAMHAYVNGRTPNPPPQEPKKIQRNDGKIYDSLEDAGEDMGIHPSIICNQLKGRQKTAKGYTFEYI